MPPPEASRPFWCGDHAMALTWFRVRVGIRVRVRVRVRARARVRVGVGVGVRVGVRVRARVTAAVCSLKRRTGDVECGDQMYSLLSLPPDASCCPSKDHRRPHTW